MKTVYALIVSIDDYPIPAHRLRGCVNDATQFSDYIHQFSTGQKMGFLEKRLFDANATRENVAAGFSHFSQAQPGDTCVFYYSGHGSLTKAPAEITDEPDGMSESIVCYDSRINNGRDLLDKELAYLIAKAREGKDVHFLTVMDSCHSGGATREMAPVAGGGLYCKSRMADPSFFQPKAPDLLGYEDFLKNNAWTNASHVHLSAAKSDQTAKEMEMDGTPRGVFTYSLIETLKQSSGGMRYRDLVDRVNLRVRNRAVDQSPQLEEILGQSGPDAYFLKVEAGAAAPFLVGYDQNGKAWTLNAGEIQGIPREGGTLKLEDGAEVNIVSVSPNQSTVSGLEIRTDTNRFYRATPDSIPLPPMKIAFAPDAEEAGTRFIVSELQELKSPELVLTDQPSEADYLIRAYDGAYRMTTKDAATPLFKRIQTYSAQSADTFIAQMETVARWKRGLERQNRFTQIGDRDIKIEVFEPAQPTDPEVLVDPPYIFRQPASDKETRFRLKITNTSQRPLWMSVVYFGSDFSMDNGFLRKVFLQPGQSEWARYQPEGANENLPFYIPPAYLTWGVNELSEYFKIFVGTDEINTDVYRQDGLQPDDRSGALRAMGLPAARSIASADWRAYDVPFKIVCPMDAAVVGQGGLSAMTGLTISAPAGFSAQASLTTTDEARRATEMPSAQKTTGAGSRAVAVSGEAAMAPFRNSALAPRGALEGSGQAPVLDTLELQNVQGKLSQDQPLKIQFAQAMGKDEAVIPLGYDAATGLYMPLGYTDATGSVNIERLPEPTLTTRSIGGSIKIFFKKTVLKRLGLSYDYPALRMASFPNAAQGDDAFDYISDPEAIKAKVASAQRVAIFVHGITGDTTVMTKAMIRSKTADGKPILDLYGAVLTFDYESLGTTIEQTAKDMRDALAKIGIDEKGPKKLEIISHSMGGLVARWFIEQLNGAKIVSRLIQIGTPNAGSEWGNVKDMVNHLLTIVVNGSALLQPWLWPLSIVGRFLAPVETTLEEMRPGSDFMDKLNAPNIIDPGIPYFLVAGNTDLLRQIKDPEGALLQRIVENIFARGLYPGLDKALFKEINDICVRVKSMEGIAGGSPRVPSLITVVVASDHISYFDQPQSLAALAKFVV